MSNHKKTFAKAAGVSAVGYTAGYQIGKRHTSTKSATHHRTLAKRTSYGIAGTSAYLALTPAGQRHQVRHTLTGAGLMSSGYAGYAHAQSRKLPKPKTKFKGRIG